MIVVEVSRMWRLALTLLGIVSLALSGCSRPTAENTTSVSPTPPANTGPASPPAEGTSGWSLTSSAFSDGATIPAKYTADGPDVSPPLAWTTPPSGTAALALICDDPDAPAGTWTHWVVYGMAPDLTGLKEGLPKEASVTDPKLTQGTNSFGKAGWGGPSPPPGKPHHYQFTLYALSAKVDLKPGAKKGELQKAMEGKVLAQAQLTGTYGR
jgi:Raf kinase inhibitor-like YbhB/YbcL family protein